MKTTLQILSLLFLINCSNKTDTQMKNNFSLKYFEKDNFTELKDEYIAKTIQINHNKINVDLNFDNKNPKIEELKLLNKFLVHLENTIIQNEIRLKNDFGSSEENNVKEYISTHLQEIPKNELSKLINENDKSKNNEQKIFEKLKLTRIGIYPQDKFQYGVFDYTIGENFTQYVISIRTDKEGKIEKITIES